MRGGKRGGLIGGDLFEGVGLWSWMVFGLDMCVHWSG